jgi:hypothetical protein
MTHISKQVVKCVRAVLLSLMSALVFLWSAVHYMPAEASKGIRLIEVLGKVISVYLS